MLRMILVILLGMLVSCGKAPTEKVPTQGRFAENLTGKSNEEILSLKYNNQVSLRCQVRVNNGDFIDLRARANDEMVWAIPGELSSLRVMNYMAGDKSMVIVIKMNGGLSFLPQKNYVAENRREYYMENTPKLDILYRRAPKSILNSGEVHERMAYIRRTLYENVEERLFTMRTGRGEEEVTEDLRCTLLTNIDPLYRMQWQIIR